MVHIKEIKTEGYYRVVEGTDELTGFHGIIAIHNINLGHGLGGTRSLGYASKEDKLKDALALAKGMTYKNALAGLDAGGGKAVVNDYISFDQLKSYADMLNEVNKDDGHVYTTAGDVGIASGHLHALRNYTPYVVGHVGEESGVSTARGVFHALEAALALQHEKVSDKVVSIMGYGKVGSELAALVKQNQGKVLVSDIRDIPELDRSSKGNLSTAHWEGHVFSPCALGGALTQQVINDMPRGHIVVGGANNQIFNPVLAYPELRKKSITYVPDYLANAGGVIDLGTRTDDDYDVNRVKLLLRLGRIYETTKRVLEESSSTGRATQIVADHMAEERIYG